MDKHIVEEVPEFYRIITLEPFRKTEGVRFDLVPMDLLPRIDGIDRVIHDKDALSPGPVGGVERPWYLHQSQEDNLIVLHGVRTVDIYTLKHRRVETFVVEPERVLKNGTLVYDGPAMLVWPCNVFHRIRSGERGSASLNFAVRHPGFDIRTNFSVYRLDTDTGDYSVIRAGHLDQN
ncbi:MAG: hypothetical protein JW923_10195 [Spirochaetales bacterium]|nr:hypothetical protein [Spirochaetales bacterium]MBP7264117.1 hypothetical protein [Spirochaetia bacterium]